jgi:hypothetical protein
MTFKLAPKLKVETRFLENGHREYTVTTSLLDQTGVLQGQGIGSCSTLESKYRYRNQQRTCPTCGQPAIMKSKFGKGGWYCNPKKNGCGANFPLENVEIESQDIGKTENPDIADVYNTCLKMAKKRSFVDASLTVTGASDIFTQDLEETLPEAQVISEEETEPPAAEMDQMVVIPPKKTVKVEMPSKSDEIGGSENFVDRIKRNVAAEKQQSKPAPVDIPPVEIMKLGDVATADGWAHVIQEVIGEYGEDSVEAGILTSVDPEELQRLAIILKPVKLVVDDGKAILRLAASLLNPLIIPDLKVYIDQCENAVKDKGITWNEAHWANYFAYFAKQKQLKKSE